MTILITGGTGFLGTYLVHHLVEHKGVVPSDVVVFDRDTEFRWPCAGAEEVVRIVGDVTDAPQVAAAMADHGVDLVVHFAFAVGSPATGQIASFVELECLGTTQVYEAAWVAGVSRVVLGSSIASYGQHAVDELTEVLSPHPGFGMYGSCKLWTEALAADFVQAYGMESVSLRFGSIFGLGRANRGSYHSGLLTGIPRDFRASVELALAGGAVVVPDHDEPADFCYAFDAAEAVWLALTAPKPGFELYNVTGPRAQVWEFTDRVRQLLPDAPVEVGGATGIVHQLMGTARIRDDLGFVPAYGIDDGLEDYVMRARALYKN